MKYRKEIDGLRGIAVLLVVLFHAGFSWIRGGFVGVDVFFVISGYLITTLILSEKASGVFSLRTFYERRARRILPALLLVLLACLPVVWLWMLPLNLKNFSASLMAVALFGSNFLFWREHGYFAAADVEKPLLHTWSLAVEEQFYVLFPLVAVVFWRWDRRSLAIFLSAAALISFGICEWGARNTPTANFYLLPSRGWELLVGALVALVLLSKMGEAVVTIVGRQGAQILGILGMSLIVYGALTFDRDTLFPGTSALAPTLGTALVIAFAIPKTATWRLLSHPALVGIGLISYSAYLWHQPLFAAARLYKVNTPSTGAFAALSVASLIIGYLSWRYVERPFRDRERIPRNTVVALAFGVSVAMIAIGWIGYTSNGFPSRLGPAAQRVYEARLDRNPRAEECDHIVEPSQSCIYGNARRVRIALVGDSHAAALAFEFGNLAAQHLIGLRQLTYDGCLPVRSLYRVFRTDRQCLEYNDKAFRFIGTQPSIDVVVLAARWTLGLEGSFFDNGEGGVESDDTEPLVERRGVGYKKSDEQGRIERVRAEYIGAIQDFLALGKTVILVYPIPEVGWDVPAFLARRALTDPTLAADLSTSYLQFRTRNARAYQALDAAGRGPRLVRVTPADILCNTYVPNRCLAELKGVPLYFDDDHLSNAGARLLVGAILPGLKPDLE